MEVTNKKEDQQVWETKKKIKEEEWVGILSTRKDKVLVNEVMAQEFVYIKSRTGTVKYFYN